MEKTNVQQRCEILGKRDILNNLYRLNDSKVVTVDTKRLLCIFSGMLSIHGSQSRKTTGSYLGTMASVHKRGLARSKEEKGISTESN